jgi:transcriptional regulator with XRE-family HTH domain
MPRSPGERRMEKSVHTTDYASLLELLRETRRTAGVTQIALAARLKKSQSFVSKIEVGETRLDVIQLRTICRALGTSLRDFVGRLEARLERDQRRRQG